MANITKWNHGLKSASSPLGHKDFATLDHFVYNEDSVVGRLDGSVPVTTTLNTFYIGDQHGLSSGNENVFFSNETTKVNWYPPWIGVKDHRVEANRDESGLIYPTYRLYGKDIIEVEFNGPQTSEIVDYISETMPPEPLSVFGVDVKLGEDVCHDDLIIYRAYVADPMMPLEEARPVYEQTIKVTYKAGEVVSWWFDHPIDANPGSIFYILVFKKFKNDKERLLKTYGSASTNPILGTSRPWINLKYRTFEDISITSDPTALFITGVSRRPPTGNDHVTEVSADGFNVDEIITNATKLTVTVEWDRARNHLDVATINNIPVTITSTQGGTHHAKADIVINPNSGEDIVFKVGRTSTRRCKVTPL